MTQPLRSSMAAARHRVLADAGWDVERDGLAGAPPIRVIVSQERHVTVDRALRVLGLGTSCLEPVDADERGTMRPLALARRLREGEGPTIVCAQAGDVNTGAVDPLDEVCDAARRAGAWVHVDGAFGLWACASPRRRPLLRGCERADSWATDGHKWLNVPYDCGIAIVADREAHRRAMAVEASYLQQGEPVREPLDWNPEFSRRARALPVYAALERMPYSYLEASADLGGHGFTTLRRVILPLAVPGLAAGSIFTFSLTLGDYIAPSLVGGPGSSLIGTVVFENLGLANNAPFAAAFATIPLAIMAVYLTLMKRLGAFESL